jgi:hypothetical protein
MPHYVTCSDNKGIDGLVMRVIGRMQNKVTARATLAVAIIVMVVVIMAVSGYSEFRQAHVARTPTEYVVHICFTLLMPVGFIDGLVIAYFVVQMVVFPYPYNIIGGKLPSSTNVPSIKGVACRIKIRRMKLSGVCYLSDHDLILHIKYVGTFSVPMSQVVSFKVDGDTVTISHTARHVRTPIGLIIHKQELGDVGPELFSSSEECAQLRRE